jgi:hypothetical protein
MNEAHSDQSLPISAEQKRATLDAVLRSSTFSRADQLKSFLKYVCEMELEGRGNELTEYLIGVEALGRPSNYSPGDDSAVRNRAFALRKKLQEYYEQEKPDSSIRIEIHKGSYCPHYVESDLVKKGNGNGSTQHGLSTDLMPAWRSQEIAIPAETVQESSRNKIFLSFTAGVLFTALAAAVLYAFLGAKQNSGRRTPTISQVMAEAWGPILTGNPEVLICVANPPSLSVHPNNAPASPAENTPASFNDPGGHRMPRELYDWYKLRYPSPENYNFFLTITMNATYWGDSLGAMTVLKMLTAAGVNPQMFPEKVVSVPTLRKRNVVLFGAPEYSPAVAHFLEKCPLSVDYLSSIVSRDPGQLPAKQFATRRDEKNRVTEVYGLITVLPSESSVGHGHRTVIFSGVNSAGTQAAAEFFSSPEHLNELLSQLAETGHKSFPPAYQVVVRAKTDESILVSFEYESHRVIP